jgi:hypothetical protein
MEAMNEGRAKRGEVLLVKPKPLEENIIVLELVNRYGPIFVNGMGGVNSHGIQLALDTENIHDIDRKHLITKIIAFISAGLNTDHQ